MTKTNHASTLFTYLSTYCFEILLASVLEPNDDLTGPISGLDAFNFAFPWRTEIIVYESSQKNRGRRICVISSSLRTNEVFSITSTEWSRVQQAAERAVAASIVQKGAKLEEEQSGEPPMKMQLRPTR